MKIGQKIILGFMVIAALFGMAGGIHVAHLMQMKTQIDQIISTNLGELEFAEEVFNAVEEAHATILHLLADARHKTHEEHAAHIRQTDDTIKTQLNEAKIAISAMEKTTLKQIAQGYPENEDDELREIRMLREHVKTFFNQSGELAALLKGGEYYTARVFTNENITPISLNVQALVSDLEMDAREEIEAALTAAKTDTQRSIWSSILLTLVAFIVAIGLGLYLSRSISARVKALHTATTRLGEGKLDTRVEITSNDELDQIAADVNHMAEGLRSAIVSRDDLHKEVAQRKEVEVQLRAQRTQAQIYLDIADVMLVALDANGYIKLINRKGCQVLGYKEHEIINKNWFEQCITEDIRKDIQAVFTQLMAGKVEAVENHENTAITKAGEQKTIAFHNAVIRDEHDRISGILFSGEDITQRKLTEDSLRDSEERIRLLLDSTEEAIYGLDLDGNCTFANAAFMRLLGYDSHDELTGKHLHEMMHHTRADGSPYPDNECRACMSFRIGRGEHVDDELFWRKDGSSFPVSYWSRPVRRNGQITGSVVTFLDISERIKASDALKESGERLRTSLEGTIAAISKSVEARDPYTAGHQLRVAELAVAIARGMGCEEGSIEGIRMGASIHDIGKIQLPAEILSKPGKLSAIEYCLVQAHTKVGYDILKDIAFPWPVADIAHQHHEHMDGSGYPQGLKGADICMEARIVAVADVVEAIASHRPYRPALGIEKALDEIRTQRGTFYDPKVVDACLKLFAEGKFSFNIN
ncbi:MAG: hypothetical protein COW19_06435 [Zetaproteobacteria bacterium CG12_big_fil_rev_8_21_14_0_65_55_1124]|nr:MAG: hypothetical protein AUJ58_01550 [Zetaproteobacteria bacterium CG1_02_55_237]PIS18837.1 MAG: hypothetical protein COT53_08730 [Zetaproteobacteria bacterium CG08_land_8_20_14_0_20_55_17]PIW42756.1 MAG: hypothetical protein COW19_06435 [Zetaproteobacteria bacterium CG12_big_fil_rev_8_21_14_0_65_55_1124]PIY51782.1 MAG: hypothetical protein COZ01_09990 [Zetaproteobacteria bacterium CG_4_10_14_0_8_um_filter_55_43]PIZ40034.1 MAG: hypothetical protein COY36_00890 [Zetaproteobacteria bacterium 